MIQYWAGMTVLRAVEGACLRVLVIDSASSGLFFRVAFRHPPPAYFCPSLVHHLILLGLIKHLRRCRHQESPREIVYYFGVNHLIISLDTIMFVYLRNPSLPV